MFNKINFQCPVVLFYQFRIVLSVGMAGTVEHRQRRSRIGLGLEETQGIERAGLGRRGQVVAGGVGRRVDARRTLRGRGMWILAVPGARSVAIKPACISSTNPTI